VKLLQDAFWASGPHGLPPMAAATVTLRARAWVPPPPQLSVHADQEDQAPATQSTAHDTLLHGRVSFRAGQGAPPYAGRVAAARARTLAPAPSPPLQLLAHADHGPHAVTLQSTRHSIATHASQLLPSRTYSWQHAAQTVQFREGRHYK
jgi:hypothetical protein